MSAANNGHQEQLHISSALLAWVFPGLGYLHRGEKVRGLCVMASVVSLIFAGVLVGGLNVCDANRSPGYGFVQKFSLPGLVLNVVARRTQLANAQAADNTGGRPEEIGLIFTGVAGFLNLMAIAGSLTAIPVKRPEQQADKETDFAASSTAPVAGEKL